MRMMVVALVACACLLLGACRDPSIPTQICVENIKSIRLGMSQVQVEAVLGAPRACEEGQPIQCRYLSPLSTASLTVDIRDGKVEWIQAKSGGLFDDHDIYLLSADRDWQHEDFTTTFPPCSADH